MFARSPFAARPFAAVSTVATTDIPVTGAAMSAVAGTVGSLINLSLIGGSAQFTAGNISVFQLRVVGASATFAAGLLVEVPVSGQRVASGYMQTLRVYPRTYSWPEKDPGDALIYGFDVQDWLVRDGLTLLSFAASSNNATTIAASGLLQDGLVNTGLWLQLSVGTSGLVTQVTLNLNCLTTDGLTTQRTAKVALPVQSRTPSAATSYPATTPRVLLPGNEYTVVIEEALGTYQQYFLNSRGASDKIVDQLVLGSWLQEAGMALTGAALLIGGGLSPTALGLLVDASENVGVWFSLSGGTSGSVAQCALQFTMVDTVGLTNRLTVSFVVSFT